MAKRSPILGYNHNVRYRGLVFHVQTEDSGLLNPHLFTHLFHEGVIVSTRKLVYDAGSNEEAIKSLMQAQHKAVMKDLRRGTFDEKIEQYLGHIPGLEPRASADAAAAPARGKTEADAQASGATPVEIVNEGLSEPIELPIKGTTSDAAPVKPRTDTGDRTIPVSMPPEPGPELDPPTDRAESAQPRTKTAQKGSKAKTQTRTDIARAPTQLAAKPPEPSEVIEISIDDDEHGRHREPRDTTVELSLDDSAAVQTMPHRHTRPPSHGAATLPAMKPPSRPIAPPVVTRPTQERKRPDSDVIEVYSPAPPSVEPPPGERAERPGQYSMSRREGAAIREKTGRLEKIPTGAPQTQPLPRTRAGSGPVPVAPQGPRDSTRVTASMGSARPHGPPPVPPARVQTPATGSRVPTPGPQGRPQVTAPLASRAPSPATPAAGSGVVMTRPAVIVGAPPKQQGAQQRVRKAREDEGRGFGQGLISEKSLDEVILAYLSEDVEDK